MSSESDRPESKRKAAERKVGDKVAGKPEGAHEAVLNHPADGRAAVRDSLAGEDVEVLVTYSDEPGAVWEPALKRDSTEPDAEKEAEDETEVHDEL